MIRSPRQAGLEPGSFSCPIDTQSTIQFVYESQDKCQCAASNLALCQWLLTFTPHNVRPNPIIASLAAPNTKTKPYNTTPRNTARFDSTTARRINTVNTHTHTPAKSRAREHPEPRLGNPVAPTCPSPLFVAAFPPRLRHQPPPCCPLHPRCWRP